jgi:cell division transport system permease protein
VRLSSLSFLIEEAAKNVKRNGLMSLAALSTVAISMAVLGGALFTLFRLHQFAEAQPRQFEMQVFLKEDSSRDDVMDVKRRIQRLPGVTHVTLFSKEQALAEMQQRDREGGTEISAALDNANPLPDRLDVRLEDPRDTRMISAAVKDAEHFPEVHRVQDAQSTLDMIFSLQIVVRNVGLAAAALLFLATSFVIQNTIRLTVFARRREIRVMQLVGATPGFIRMPLVLEGVFYGITGALIATAVVVFVIIQVSNYAGKFVSPLAQNMPPPVGFGFVVAVQVTLGAIIGLIGSLLSIRRFLKKV